MRLDGPDGEERDCFGCVAWALLFGVALFVFLMAELVSVGPW